MDKKSLQLFIKEVKADGSAIVVFATLNVVDKDGDITLPGAFGEQTVKIQPAHDWSAPNIGMAKIREVKDEVIADMKFYLNTAGGREWYETIKANYENDIQQEYSYGFNILQEDRRDVDGRNVRGLLKLKVHEVSPVLLGAGENTRTLAVKKCTTCGGSESEDKTITTCTCNHAKETPQQANIKVWAQIPNSWEAVQEALRMAAHEKFVDENSEGWVSVEGTFSNQVIVSVYRENTHKVFQFDWTLQSDGNVALSNQTEIDLSVIIQQKSMKLEDNVTHVMGELLALKNRFGALGSLAAKEGRTLSQRNRERLSRLMAQMQSAMGEIGMLLEETNPSPEGMLEDGKALELLAEFHRTQTIIAGNIRRN